MKKLLGFTAFFMVVSCGISEQNAELQSNVSTLQMTCASKDALNEKDFFKASVQKTQNGFIILGEGKMEYTLGHFENGKHSQTQHKVNLKINAKAQKLTFIPHIGLNPTSYDYFNFEGMNGTISLIENNKPVGTASLDQLLLVPHHSYTSFGFSFKRPENFFMPAIPAYPQAGMQVSTFTCQIQGNIKNFQQ